MPHVQVFMALSCCEVDGHDAGRHHILWFALQIRGDQGGLHGAHQSLAIGRDGEAFHALIWVPHFQLTREAAVERREALELSALSVEVSHVRAVLVAHPERAIGHGHQALAVISVIRLRQHLA